MSNDNRVVCEDDAGIYITDKKKLDTGLADPARFADSAYRRKVVTAAGLGEFLKKEEKVVVKKEVKGFEKKPEKSKYPSHYGSHKTMIHEEATAKLNNQVVEVVES